MRGRASSLPGSTPLIGDLIDTGVDILNPMQPECVDLEMIVSEYSDRVAFSGMIGTQSTLSFGSAASSPEPSHSFAGTARCRRHP